MVSCRPYKFFLHDFAIVAKISIFDSYMASKIKECTFLRSFNTHTKLIQQSLSTYGIILPYLVHTWLSCGSYIVLTLFLYGPYMVLIGFLHGLIVHT